MKPWLQLAQDSTPDGALLQLCRRDTEYAIRVDGKLLMSSRMHGSEKALAQLAIQALSPRSDVSVLVGGLGCGFTLRAALDQLNDTARVTVSELLPAIVEWNRGELGMCAKQPLSDPRVELHVGDIAAFVRGTQAAFDVVLLDVDNGPAAFTQARNNQLYSRKGLAAFKQCLRPNGVLAVWSVGPDAQFDQRLSKAGFRFTTHEQGAQSSKRGDRHTIWIAHRS